MNYKLLIIVIVGVAAVVFGLWFWTEFNQSQTELENLPAESSQETKPTKADTSASI